MFFQECEMFYHDLNTMIFSFEKLKSSMHIELITPHAIPEANECIALSID